MAFYISLIVLGKWPCEALVGLGTSDIYRGNFAFIQ